MNTRPLDERAGTSARLQLCLYDAQTSVTIVGIEERIWAAIGTMDTFFEPNDSTHSVSYHHEQRRTGKDTQDPISGRVHPRRGARNTGLSSLSDPRKYFLSTLEERLGETLVPEYGNIVRRMKEAVGEDRGLGSNRKQLRDLHQRHDEVLEHLRKIIDRLSKTVDALKVFKDKGIRFFIGKSQRRYLSIDTSIEELDDIKEELQKLEETAKARNEAVRHPSANNDQDYQVSSSC
jgi:hypothetical protein